MHSILFNEALDEPNNPSSLQDFLNNLSSDIERKYGIVSRAGSHVTTIPKDKINDVKDGIENNIEKDVFEEEEEEEINIESPHNNRVPTSNGRKSRVIVVPNSIIHRIKRNFTRKKAMNVEDKLNLKNNRAKIVNRMKVHVLTIPITLRGKVIKGIQRHSINKAKREIQGQSFEINRLIKVIDKRKKYNEYQQQKIKDRDLRKAEKIKKNKEYIYQQNREEIERDERIADMEKVNRRDEKERIAQEKADFKYALKQHDKEQKLQNQQERDRERERQKAQKEEERKQLKEKQRQLKEQQRQEINDMLNQLKEQQIKETEKLREEYDRLNAIIKDNKDTIENLEHEEDELKGRKSL